VMIRVPDVDAHYRAVVAAGAHVTSKPTDTHTASGSTACVTRPAICGPSPSPWPTSHPRPGAA
jgi:hypothetical protein